MEKNPYHERVNDFIDVIMRVSRGDYTAQIKTFREK